MKNKLTYFVSRSYMFGIGSFLIYKGTGKDAWISILLGIILGIIIIYIYSLLKKELDKNKLKDTLNNSFLGKIYIIIFIIFYLLLIITTLTLLPLFVNSFYLLYTPKIIINIPFLLIAIYLTSKGKIVLESLSTFLCVISISVITIYALFLTKYIHFTELTPLLTSSSFQIIKGALIYASVSSIPNIITINYNGDFKSNLKDYLLASAFSLAVTIFTVASLGETLVKIYSFPEYAVLKQIKILDFIENLENISSFIWYFDMFITLAVLTTNLHGILPKTYKKVFYYGLLLFCVLISSFVTGKNYRIAITLFTFLPQILAIFFLLFCILYLYLKFKKKNQN